MSDREKLKQAHAAFIVAQDKVAEARNGVDNARQARWKADTALEKFNEEPQDFASVDDALAAIAGGSEGVRTLIRTEPRKAKQAELEKEVAAWARARELAEQALAEREEDEAGAARDLDQIARQVVAAECDWPALKQRYADLTAELRKMRAQLGSLAGSVPNMSSPFVAEVDVRDLLWANPLIGAERDTTFVDWLAALKIDPLAQIAKTAV